MTDQTSNRQNNQTGQSSTGQSSKDDLKQVGREVAHEAKKAVDQATHEVKSQVDEIRQDVQSQAGSFLDEQKDVAAQRVENVADALRQTGQGFADRNEDTLAHYTDSLAEQLDNFSNTLRDREIGSLVEDAKQLAYRQPELFVAGALAAGFVIGRFFKSSGQPRPKQYGQGQYAQQADTRGYGEAYEQRYGGQIRGSQGNNRAFEADDYRNANSPRNEPFRRDAGSVTTHGLGTGQSIQHQEDLRKGQEFGQGHEQMTNDPTNRPRVSSDFADQPNRRTDRQEGERK